MQIFRRANTSRESLDMGSARIYSLLLSSIKYFLLAVVGLFSLIQLGSNTAFALTEAQLYSEFDIPMPRPVPFAPPEDGETDPRKGFRVYTDAERAQIQAYFDYTFPESGEAIPFEQFPAVQRLVRQRFGELDESDQTRENLAEISQNVAADKKLRREYQEYLVRVNAFRMMRNSPNPPAFIKDVVSAARATENAVANNQRREESRQEATGVRSTTQVEFEIRFPEILEDLKLLVETDEKTGEATEWNRVQDTDNKSELRERRERLREGYLFLGRHFLRHRRARINDGLSVESMNWHLERLVEGHKVIQGILRINNKAKRNQAWEENAEVVKQFVESWRTLARQITGRTQLLESYEARERVTERGTELAYMLGHKSRRWRDPQKWTGMSFFFGLDVIKFFTAVAVTEFYECWHKKDPLICKTFIDSLKNPHTYVGFGMFVGAAAGYSHALQSLAKISPKQFGVLFRILGPLSMAAGSIASDYYHELEAHPKWKLYRKADKIRDEARRTKIKNALLQDIFLDETIANGKWWRAKTPAISGLMASAWISGIINKGMTKAAMAGTEALMGKVVQLSAEGGRIANFATKAASAANVIRTSGVGLRVIFATAGGLLRFTFYGMMTWAVWETTVFLFTADFIGIRFDERWQTREKSSKMVDLHHDIVKTVRERVPLEREVWKRLQLEGEPPMSFLDDPVHALQKEFDDYRQSLLTEPMMVMGNYRKEKDELNKHYRQLENYYSWIVGSGANRAAPEWVRNDLGHKPEDMKKEDEWQYDPISWHAKENEKYTDHVMELTNRLDKVINKEFFEDPIKNPRKIELDDVANHVARLAANGGNLERENVHAIVKERLSVPEQKALLDEIKGVQTTFGMDKPGYGNAETYLYIWGLFCGPPPGGWMQRRPVVGEGLVGKWTKDGLNFALPQAMLNKPDAKNQSLFYLSFDSLDNEIYHRFSPACEKIVRSNGDHYNEDYLDEVLTMPHYFIPPRIFKERMPGFCENFSAIHGFGKTRHLYQDDIDAAHKAFREQFPDYKSPGRLGSPTFDTLATYGGHIKRQKYIREQFNDPEKRKQFTKLVINALRAAYNPFTLRQDEIHEKYYKRFAEEINPLMQSVETIDHVNRVNKEMITIADSVVNVPDDQLDTYFRKIFEFEESRYDSEEKTVNEVTEAIRFMVRKAITAKSALGRLDEDEFYDRFKDVFESALAVVYAHEDKDREVRSLDVNRMMRSVLVTINNYYNLGEDEAASRALSTFKREMNWQYAFTLAMDIFEKNINSRFKDDESNAPSINRFVREVMYIATDGIGARLDRAYKKYYEIFADTMDPVFTAKRENENDRFWTWMNSGLRQYRHVLDSFEHEYVYWRNMDREYGKENHLRVFEITASQVATKAKAYRFFWEYINSPEVQNYSRVTRTVRTQKWSWQLLNIPGRIDPTDRPDPYTGNEDEDCSNCSGSQLNPATQFIEKVKLYNSGLDSLEQFLLEKGA